MRIAHLFHSLKENLGSIHQNSVCVPTALPNQLWKIQLCLFILRAHLGHWTVYVLCSSSCWFWLTSPISCLTSQPRSFPSSWLSALFSVCVRRWHLSCVLHFPEGTCCLFPFVRRAWRAIERERWKCVSVRAYVCLCADRRQGRLHFLGQASGHLSCPGNPVLAGLLGNNPLLFQMI